MDTGILVPVLTVERFADLTGVSEDTVRGWIRKGCIPTSKIGKRRLVNVTELIKQLKEDY